MDGAGPSGRLRPRTRRIRFGGVVCPGALDPRFRNCAHAFHLAPKKVNIYTPSMFIHRLFIRAIRSVQLVYECASMRGISPILTTNYIFRKILYFSLTTHKQISIYIYISFPRWPWMHGFHITCLFLLVFLHQGALIGTLSTWDRSWLGLLGWLGIEDSHMYMACGLHKAIQSMPSFCYQLGVHPEGLWASPSLDERPIWYLCFFRVWDNIRYTLLLPLTL